MGCGEDERGTNESVKESANPSKADEDDEFRGGRDGGGPREFWAEGGMKALKPEVLDDAVLLGLMDGSSRSAKPSKALVWADGFDVTPLKLPKLDQESVV